MRRIKKVHTPKKNSKFSLKKYKRLKNRQCVSKKYALLTFGERRSHSLRVYLRKLLDIPDPAIYFKPIYPIPHHIYIPEDVWKKQIMAEYTIPKTTEILPSYQRLKDAILPNLEPLQLHKEALEVNYLRFIENGRAATKVEDPLTSMLMFHYKDGTLNQFKRALRDSVRDDTENK